MEAQLLVQILTPHCSTRALAGLQGLHRIQHHQQAQNYENQLNELKAQLVQKGAMICRAQCQTSATRCHHQSSYAADV